VTLQVGRTTYEVTPSTDGDWRAPGAQINACAYVLTGPRGARYALLRNVPNPAMLFAINDKNWTKSTPFDGKWFTDAGGTLRLLA